MPDLVWTVNVYSNEQWLLITLETFIHTTCLLKEEEEEEMHYVHTASKVL